MAHTLESPPQTPRVSSCVPRCAGWPGKRGARRQAATTQQQPEAEKHVRGNAIESPGAVPVTPRTIRNLKSPPPERPPPVPHPPYLSVSSTGKSNFEDVLAHTKTEREYGTQQPCKHASQPGSFPAEQSQGPHTPKRDSGPPLLPVSPTAVWSPSVYCDLNQTSSATRSPEDYGRRFDSPDSSLSPSDQLNDDLNFSVSADVIFGANGHLPAACASASTGLGDKADWEQLVGKDIEPYIGMQVLKRPLMLLGSISPVC